MTEGDEVEWLSPEERQAWVSFVLAAGEVLDGLDRALQRSAGINRSHFAILQSLSMRDDRQARMSDVAAALHFSPSRLSHAVGRLERDGWVVRRPDPEDGRGQLVAITEEGVRRIAEIAPLHIADVRAAVFDRLTADQVAQLQAISDALLDDDAPSEGPETV